MLIHQLFAGSHRTPVPAKSWKHCLHRDIYLSIKVMLAAIKEDAGEQYQWYFEDTYLEGKICMEYLSLCPKHAQLIAYASSRSSRNMNKHHGSQTVFSKMDKDQLLTAATRATLSKTSMQSSQRTSASQCEKLKVNDSIMPLELPMHVIGHLTKMKWIKWPRTRKSQKKWICFNMRQWICLVIQFHSLPVKPGETATFEERLAKSLAGLAALHLYRLYNGTIAMHEVNLESILCLAPKEIVLNVLDSQMIRFFNGEKKYRECVMNVGMRMKQIFQDHPEDAVSILSSLQAFRIVEQSEEQLTNSSHDKVWIKGQSIAFFEKYVDKILSVKKLTVKDLNSIAQATLSEIVSETPYTMDTQQSQDVPEAAEQTAFDSDADERFEVMNMDTQQSQDGLDVDADIEHDTGEERVDADKFIIQEFVATQKWCNVAMSTTFSISADSPGTSLDPDPKDDDTVLYAMKMLQKKLDSIIGKAESAHESDLAWLNSVSSTLGAQHTRIIEDNLDPKVTMELACKTFEEFINEIDHDPEFQQRKKRQKH